LVEPSDLATHGGGRDFDAVLFLEGFAMLFEGQSGVVLELGRQPLFEQRALAGGRIRDRPGLHSSRLAPPFEPTLDGRQRHQKDLCYFLPGLATIDRVQHLQSQIFRLRSHAENLLRGSIANQVAVEAQRTYLGDQHPEPFHAYFKVSRETARAPHDGFNNLSEVGRL
jgi:hypothetical protein